MKKLRKYWQKFFVGIIWILLLGVLALDKFNYLDLDKGNNFIIIFIFILLFILDGIVTFNKNHKIVCTLNLVIMLFIGIKFLIASIEILNTTYSEEIYKAIAISGVTGLLTWVLAIYFIKDSFINYKKSKKEDNELSYEVIEKTKE